MPDSPSPEATSHAAVTPVVAHVSSGRLKLAALVAGGVAAVVVVGGLVSRVSADQRQKSWTEQQAIPTIGLAKVDGGGTRDLALPGDVQAFYTAPIHARVSGYLKRWYVDIGAPVKAGQVLADIDTPDLDQQVLQARADLATAQANQGLAATTAQRWQGLVAADAVSKQEAEEKFGDLAAKNALVNSSRANLNRLLALESFKKITAPFAGVVTTRSTDIGALISATGGPTDPALFTVADQRRLRIYVRVPQNYSSLVHKGQTADLRVPEFVGQAFTAVVANSAQSVGAQSGAELVELQMDNPEGRIKSGDYAQVTFRLASPITTTRIPVTAIQYRHNGPVVAVVGPDNHVKIRSVVVSRDLGSTVEIGSGLGASERVVDNPPESLADGDLVRIAGASAQKAGA
ncbi:MAG TPA: efflux RND transporter periplasmic adaptor subunit [Phenylobacterium sp.]|jgi:RND family efflux transporter MFP subunit|uniref:efflux RND transporter periplasmic adaptor subunit n=1 Tax=Phenylobacterium sp. TaxID=1871053 RepID=UPI002C56401D|nr:efflux RND transporter periplasmic adaptor subunit [Phenylobacterium sp.]HXA38149.1 efflux RND transporter periplasmic adaptor subunit [Phenylobacterium sp.]